MILCVHIIVHKCVQEKEQQSACTFVFLCVLQCAEGGERASRESQWDTELKERKKERMHHQWSSVRIATEGIR